jgi:hypothetical protein
MRSKKTITKIGVSLVAGLGLLLGGLAHTSDASAATLQHPKGCWAVGAFSGGVVNVANMTCTKVQAYVEWRTATGLLDQDWGAWTRPDAQEASVTASLSGAPVTVTYRAGNLSDDGQVVMRSF